MKRLFYSALVSLVLFGCDQGQHSQIKTSDLIPGDSEVILKIHDLETFKNDLQNSELFADLSNSEASEALETVLPQLDALNPKHPLLVCFNGASDNLQYTIVTRWTDSITPTLEDATIKSTLIDSIFVASNSTTDLTTLKPKAQPELESLLKTTNTTRSFSLLLNAAFGERLGTSIIPNSEARFSEWLVLDSDITSDQMSFNGITNSKGSKPTITSIFEHSIPQENTLQHVTPLNADGFLSITYNNYDRFREQLFQYQQRSSDSLEIPELFGTFNEIGLIHYQGEELIALKSFDASATKEALRYHQEEEEQHRGISIFKFESPDLFKTEFKPFTNSEVQHYVILDDYVVFAGTVNVLKQVISNYQNGTVFSKSPIFEEHFSHLSDEASLLWVGNSEQLNSTLGTLLKTTESLSLGSYQFSALQLINDDGFAHINSLIKKSKKRAQQNTISEEFHLTLDAEIMMAPYFVTNHRNKQKDIVVQDIQNQLYLISNSGKVLWKKRLQGPILGKITQVDLYKNGRLQLAFATPNRVYVLDRNGNDVGAFPMKFNHPITQPLSVFDYDNNKNYRFLVTQKDVLLMFDKRAKSVKGFKYKRTGDILKQPRHFRVANKDFIVFATKDKMMALNRRGGQRLNITESIQFSDNPIFLHKKQFTTTNTKGELVQVNQRGIVSRQALGLDNNHSIDATSRTLTSLSNNELKVKQNRFELEFGDYTKPQIFYLQDKIYVATTDKQSQKVYLFDSNAKLQSNFPVYSTSHIDLTNMDTDRNLEFVTIGDPNTLLVYKKN